MVTLAATSFCQRYLWQERRPVWWSKGARGSCTRSLSLPARLCRVASHQEPTGGEVLSTEFSRFINAQGIEDPLQYRRPSPMIAPSKAVESVIRALQMNNYPEQDAGVLAAYNFSKPHDCENGQGRPTRVRSWTAHEEWLPMKEFSNMLHREPFNVIVGCSEWKCVSSVDFPSSRMGNKALQAVQFRSSDDTARWYTFTFCMERIDVGPYKGCWLIVGVREGDYSLRT